MLLPRQPLIPQTSRRNVSPSPALLGWCVIAWVVVTGQMAADAELEERLGRVLAAANAPLVERVAALEASLQREREAMQGMVRDQQAKLAKQLHGINHTVEELKGEVEKGGGGGAAPGDAEAKARRARSSYSSKSMRKGGEESEGVLDPVHTGDYIILKDASGTTSGYLMGDQAA